MGRPTDHRGKKDEVKSKHRHQAKLDHNPSVDMGKYRVLMRGRQDTNERSGYRRKKFSLFPEKPEARLFNPETCPLEAKRGLE